MPTDLMEDRYFDLEGLAAYSGLSEKTLRRYMTDPEHPLPNHYVKAGEKDRGKIFISKREFDAWVASFPPLKAHAKGRLEARVAAAVKSMRGSDR
jgi:hypothetical protein